MTTRVRPHPEGHTFALHLQCGLHALLVAHIAELGKRIAADNTDIYKSFWNLDSYSRPKMPRPEDACRDTLVTLLRPTLAPKGITVEPEGHMVAEPKSLNPVPRDG